MNEQMKKLIGSKLTRKQAYSILSAIVCSGKSSKVGLAFPQLHKYIDSRNFVDASKFNNDFPIG